MMKGETFYITRGESYLNMSSQIFIYKDENKGGERITLPDSSKGHDGGRISTLNYMEKKDE